MATQGQAGTKQGQHRDNAGITGTKQGQKGQARTIQVQSGTKH